MGKPTCNTVDRVDDLKPLDIRERSIPESRRPQHAPVRIEGFLDLIEPTEDKWTPTAVVHSYIPGEEEGEEELGTRGTVTSHS